ncbi:TPA: hypothetical protein QEM96_004142 [Pseudomonas putida]|nr:hypothetical protein [Pseudomonas putida]
MNTPAQAPKRTLQLRHGQRPGELGNYPEAPLFRFLSKVLLAGSCLADEQQTPQRARTGKLFQERKPRSCGHGVVEDEQVRATVCVQARVQANSLFGDAHIENALGIECLVQEDLMGRACLVNQHVGPGHEPLLREGLANLGNIPKRLNRKHLKNLVEISIIQGRQAAPDINALKAAYRDYRVG